MTTAEPIPVILDVDTGYDDALALMLALRSPRLEVIGVTCVHGNQQLDQVVVNTLKVLDIAGAADIPVAAGMRQPLLEAIQPPSLIHGHDGMGDLGLATSTRQLAEAHAVELLRQLLSQAAVPVTLIALAPLTNIAVLLRMYPEVRSKIAGITIMGGTFIAPGNTSPLAEFNVRVDPEAAAIVLQSGLPIRLYPLDVFRQIYFNRAEITRFKSSADGVAQAVAGILTYACNYFKADYSLIGDAGAVATVIEPEAAIWEQYPVMVELAGTAGRGQTVFDRRSARQRRKADAWWQPLATEIEVATALDVERYRRLFAEAVDQAWSNP
jgi:pyrimidine-specific ribonucleoside hydrolase